MKLYDTREEYHNEDLVSPSDVPERLFETWYAEAHQKEHSPNAMAISTVDSKGQPWTRMVLLKAFEDGDFVFFTNTESQKASHIKGHSSVCLHFYWKSLHRQVQIHGEALPVSRAEAVTYFLSRPLESQISSWVSDQSQPIESRKTLLEKLRDFRDQLPAKLSAPHHWGGYRVRAIRMEFWQGAEHRLHHRVVFERQGAKGAFGQGVILSP